MISLSSKTTSSNIIQVPDLKRTGIQDGGGGLELTVALRIAHKLAQLHIVPLDDIEANQPIAAYGIDSIIAGELRNWIGKGGVAVSIATRSG